MTGTTFVGLVAAVLLVAGLTTIIVQFYGKAKETKSYTYIDEKNSSKSRFDELRQLGYRVANLRHLVDSPQDRETAIRVDLAVAREKAGVQFETSDRPFKY